MSETVKLYGINRLRETLVVAEATRKSMQGNRSRDTKPELALRRALWTEGHRGYRKNVRRLAGTPDIVFGRAKVAVFVHGCFWHGHDCGQTKVPKQNRGFWVEKMRRNQERHERNLLILKGQGYVTFTFWECELKNGMDAIVRQIQGALAGRP